MFKLLGHRLFFVLLNLLITNSTTKPIICQTTIGSGKAIPLGPQFPQETEQVIVPRTNSDGSSANGQKQTSSCATRSGIAALTPTPPLKGFHLTFDDEMHSLSASADPFLYKTLWCTCSWFYPPSGTASMTIKDGHLEMASVRESDGTWTSAHLNTFSPAGSAFTQNAGYYETCFQGSGQKGILTDFYLTSADYMMNAQYPSNELDVFEKPTGTLLYLTLHFGFGSTAIRFNQITVPADFDSMPHAIGVLIDPDLGQIAWYVDGQQVFAVDKFNDTGLSPMVMTLESGASGGVFGLPDMTTVSPAITKIYWLRVYSRDPSVHEWSTLQ